MFGGFELDVLMKAHLLYLQDYHPAHLAQLRETGTFEAYCNSLLCKLEELRNEYTKHLEYTDEPNAMNVAAEYFEKVRSLVLSVDS